MDGFAGRVARIADAMSGRGDDWTEPFAETLASMEADLRARQAKWERDRPVRERAERAQRRANIIRRGELGLDDGSPVPIAAAMWAVEPSGRWQIFG